ncbi:MAG: hypothetical protein J6K05_06295 [Bacteroidaceae bacterium]|nr:hypothetical protein [Bacteroidaceae bacterium]
MKSEEKKTRYVVTNKRGEEIYHSDSFLGFVISTIVVTMGSMFVLLIIAVIVCGIGS